MPAKGREMLGSLLFAFFMSAVKYLFGALFCLGAFPYIFKDSYLSYAMGFLVSSSGGIAGCIFFTYGERWLDEYVFKRYFFKKGKRINKRNRFFVKLKHNGGLPLVAFLTPVFLTIPVGSILATTFIHSRKKIIVYMALSVMIWGMFIFGAPWLLGFNIAEWLSNLW